jgi:hypothetical protein
MKGRRNREKAVRAEKEAKGGEKEPYSKKNTNNTLTTNN